MKQIRKKKLIGLSALVALCVTIALIVPALTLDTDKAEDIGIHDGTAQETQITGEWSDVADTVDVTGDSSVDIAEMATAAVGQSEDGLTVDEASGDGTELVRAVEAVVETDADFSSVETPEDVVKELEDEATGGYYVENDGAVIPVEGNIVVFDNDGNKEPDQLGIITDVKDEDTFDAVVVGEDGNIVEESFNTESDEVSGFGVLVDGDSESDVADTAGDGDEGLTVPEQDEDSQENSEEIKLTATTKSGVTVTLEASNGAFAYPNDEIVMTAEETKTKLAKKMLEEEYENADEVRVFDISLWHDEEKIEPAENVKVTFEGITENEISSVDVYRLDEEKNKAVEIKSEIEEDGTVVMEADHFSDYAVYITYEAQGTEITGATSLQKIKNGGTYYLSKDVTANGPITIPAGVTATLNLNGHKLTVSDVNNLVIDGGTLIIQDSQSAVPTESKVNTKAVCNRDGGYNGVYNNGKLTYYVTEVEISDGATGATEESLVKCEVTGKGMIVSSNGGTPITVNNGGTFTINSGMIAGGTARAITSVNSTVNLNGGYICGNSEPKSASAEFGGAVKASGGTVNLSGTVLAANSAPNGGALSIEGATLNMTGGVISGNVADGNSNGNAGNAAGTNGTGNGGGIYASKNAVLNISDGYVTNNRALSTNYYGGGGAVALNGITPNGTSHGTTLNLSGDGKLSGNYAKSGGGGVCTRSYWGSGGQEFQEGLRSSIIMTGGFITANECDAHEGGGISIEMGSSGRLSGGHITNNKCNTPEDWGGGGVFNSGGSTLQVVNTLVTNNEALGYGGGMAGCSTGRLSFYVDSGIAVFDNHAIGDDAGFSGGSSSKRDDWLYKTGEMKLASDSYHDYFCALYSFVAGTMPGGGGENWSGTVDGTTMKK